MWNMEISKLSTVEVKDMSTLTCFHVNACLCVCLSVCLSVCMHVAEHMGFWEGVLWNMRWNKRGRELPHIVTQKREPCSLVCVFALKKEDSCVECTGRGETLSLPSSYFPLNSCVCLWEGGGCEKRGRKGNDILTLQHVLFPQMLMFGFWLTAIKFSLPVYCLSDSEREVSLSISPFSLWLTVTSTPSLLSARLHSY